MTHRVGPKGQVVIPKEMRDQLGIESGDEVEFELRGDAVEVRRMRATRSLKGMLAGHELVEALEADRQAGRG